MVLISMEMLVGLIFTLRPLSYSVESEPVSSDSEIPINFAMVVIVESRGASTFSLRMRLRVGYDMPILLAIVMASMFSLSRNS